MTRKNLLAIARAARAEWNSALIAGDYSALNPAMQRLIFAQECLFALRQYR